MLFKQVTLENFGPYKGSKSIDMRINSPRQNVILIGGENGAGKTTLLNAIKVALFGPYAYGYKTESDAYMNKIKNYLNTQALKEKENSFRVILEYSEVENYKRTNYTIYRHWKITKKSILEKIDISKDSHFLNETEKEIYQSKLRESMPPQLFDLCLFDGEEISRIIGDNLLSSYLMNLSKVIFNLNLFENLEDDLNNLLKAKLDDDSITLYDRDIQVLKQNLDSNQEVITKHKSEHFEAKSILLKYQEDANQLRKEFEVHGGLYKEERDQLVQEVNSIENERSDINNKVKSYIATMLPFELNKDLLTHSIKQMEDESTEQVFIQIDQKLDDSTLSRVINDLGIDANSSKSMNQLLKNSLLEHLRTDIDQHIHRASFAQRSQVAQVAEILTRESPQDYAKLLKKNKELLLNSQQLRKKINTHDQTNEFTQMINNMEQCNQKIVTQEQCVVEIQQKLQEAIAMKDEFEKQLFEKQKERHHYYKERNAFSISEDLINLSKEFRKIQQQKKLQDVESEAIRMLKKLMRKQNYISSVRIHAETFEIFLYDKKHETLDLAKLSAGEKEILLLSLIWAMFKSSGRRVPFIFDTLLGRLDQTHKTTVLSELIPACGEQAMILSTDTEIDQNNYHLLKPYLAHEYMLDYDTENQSVNIHNNYFFQSENGVSL